jgi:hypothetical protein
LINLKPYFLIIIALSLPVLGSSQSTNASLNEDYYHWIDRNETKSGYLSKEIFTAVKPYERKAIVAFTDTLSGKGLFTSKVDLFNLEYLRNDSWEWSRSESSLRSRPFWKFFYKRRPDLLSVDKEDFDLHVNPVLYWALAKDSRQADPLYVNTRGIEIRGLVDQRISFYTFFFDNQSLLPLYVTDEVNRTLAVPHEGFWKDFKSGSGKDYLQARGYISFRATKNIAIQFGQDRTFIGNGYRSLIFSDYSAPNLFLRANVKVWKLNYMYQLNRLTSNIQGNTSGLTGNDRYPQKFFAFHHASINASKKLNIGLFESVIFSPSDSSKTDYFDFAYLNPIIFYRAVEQQFGSSDNVILGADFKWLLAKKISLYGQFVLDEFVLDEIKAGDGWWGNKYGIQLGAKWIDVFGVFNLDWQIEGNLVRPYTYSHGSTFGSYTNYHQSLAHPAGANFKELVSIIRYQPIPRLNLLAKAFYIKTGQDLPGENWGTNILKDNGTRQMTYGNSIGQGNPVDILFFDFTASYMLKHNLFIDFKQVIRNSESTLSAYNNNTSLSSLALRLNIAQRNYEF